MTIATDTLGGIQEMIRTNRLDEAGREFDSISETDENRAALTFLRGYLLEMRYDWEGAIAAYEKTLELDPDQLEATFRCARLADQYGDDEWALELYQRCRDWAEAPANALINLAVLHEERGDLKNAELCLADVLEEFPTHRRARHFLKSVDSAHTMIYDEQSQQERERHSAILDMPISEFELSVRSRNCLRQMNIRTLGDLLRTTEPELLSYKNFGETSLFEIRALLEQKKLRIGQALLPSEPFSFRTAAPVSEDASAQLNRTISELELSVRSRKALQRLGVATIGDLVQRTEAELMTIKNFGQTSLNEIKRQLAKFGVSLRAPGG